eukprot:TRINITY_DN2839_c0_g1_i1.p2 TRINITY_DN2839_c0_g1~~TRINITY_DN2839_c0_g1_i1.p2  ORF type:complete len:355 (-),score=33.42 TRINITY_DN2839_c0_g1_i1:30-1094(-)
MVYLENEYQEIMDETTEIIRMATIKGRKNSNNYSYKDEIVGEPEVYDELKKIKSQILIFDCIFPTERSFPHLNLLVHINRNEFLKRVKFGYKDCVQTIVVSDYVRNTPQLNDMMFSLVQDETINNQEAELEARDITKNIYGGLYMNFSCFESLVRTTFRRMNDDSQLHPIKHTELLVIPHVEEVIDPLMDIEFIDINFIPSHSEGIWNGPLSADDLYDLIMSKSKYAANCQVQNELISIVYLPDDYFLRKWQGFRMVQRCDTWIIEGKNPFDDKLMITVQLLPFNMYDTITSPVLYYAKPYNWFRSFFEYSRNPGIIRHVVIVTPHTKKLKARVMEKIFSFTKEIPLETIEDNH